VKEESRIHRFDRILQLLVPDKRERIGGVPVIHPWSISENHSLLIELIDSGFMTGVVEESIGRRSLFDAEAIGPCLPALWTF